MGKGWGGFILVTYSLNLASITYNNQTYDVTNIESTAFSYNGFITSVDIHAPITETGSMFSGCTSLTSVSLPETVTTIG